MPEIEEPARTEPIARPAGVWWLRDEAGQPFDLCLFENGQAVSTSVKGTAGPRGGRGFWRLRNGAIEVFLAGGWTHRIFAAEGSFTHAAFAPGITAQAAYESEAGRVSEGERFVGVWRLNREPDGSFLYITIQSGGEAFSTVGGLTSGRWEETGDAVRCMWPDGWVDELSFAAGAWRKRSWVGGDETLPADLSEAVRVGEEPFEIAP